MFGALAVYWVTFHQIVLKWRLVKVWFVFLSWRWTTTTRTSKISFYSTWHQIIWSLCNQFSMLKLCFKGSLIQKIEVTKILFRMSIVRTWAIIIEKISYLQLIKVIIYSSEWPVKIISKGLFEKRFWRKMNEFDLIIGLHSWWVYLILCPINCVEKCTQVVSSKILYITSLG